MSRYHYTLSPEVFQKLRVFAVEQGFFPYGLEEFQSIVITKRKDGWMQVRVDTKPYLANKG